MCRGAQEFQEAMAQVEMARVGREAQEVQEAMAPTVPEDQEVKAQAGLETQMDHREDRQVDQEQAGHQVDRQVDRQEDQGQVG